MSKQTKKNNFCTQHVLNLFFSCNSMNNLFSYCGLTDARMRVSEKDLSLCIYKNMKNFSNENSKVKNLPITKKEFRKTDTVHFL